MDTLNLLGRINENGGLLIPMDLVRDFCRKHPRARAVLKLIALSADQTAAQRGYYWGYIVPECRKALMERGSLETDATTDNFLRSECPLCYREGRLVSVAELDAEDMAGYIEWLKQYAAENLNTFIEDPYTL